MLPETLIAVFLGILAGTITGLIPGLHINLVAIIMLAAVSAIKVSPYGIGSFIVAMSITHTFIDFIPSIFLGAPDADTALAILPGHKLLLNGFGYGAFRLTLIGSVSGLMIAAAFSPLLLLYIPAIFNLFSPIIPHALIFILIFSVLRDDKIPALLVVVLSGTIGIVTLTANMSQPLLPLLSGLFGVSTLLVSSKNTIPTQSLRPIAAVKPKRTLITGFLSGSFLSLFPSLGPAQAALVGRFITGNSARTYLVLLGCINTVSMMIALMTAFTIGKARNGSIEVLSQLIQPTLQTTITWIAVALVIAAPVVVIALFLAMAAARFVAVVNIRVMSTVIIMLIAVTVFMLSGAYGILVLITATSIGLLAISMNIARHHLMAALVLPVALQML